MYASGKGAHLENGKNGVIHLSGESEENRILDATSDSSLDGSGLSEFGKDNNGNIAMKIEDGATMVNKGKIEFEVEPQLKLSRSIEVTPQLKLDIALTKISKSQTIMHKAKSPFDNNINYLDSLRNTFGKEITVLKPYVGQIADGMGSFGLKREIYSTNNIIPASKTYNYINSIGLASKSRGKITNTGIIEGSLMYGMYAEYNSVAINYGKIKDLKRDEGPLALDSSGMVSELNSIITNQASGQILGVMHRGMYASGLGSKAVNNGLINISSNDDKISYGMYIEDGAVGINNKDIYLDKNQSIGMYAIGIGSKIENNGTIHLNGTRTNGIGNIGSSENGSGLNEFGTDNHGNIAMKIENGATMINKGKIIFEGK